MHGRKQEISWTDFEKVDLRVGTIVDAEAFAEARKPAVKLLIDFGSEVGRLKSSAQITDIYTPEDLIGRQIIAVVNFPKKQIGPMMSECLCMGIVGDSRGVVLLEPDRPVANGLAIG